MEGERKRADLATDTREEKCHYCLTETDTERHTESE